MRWLPDCSPATLAGALRVVAPGLGARSIEIADRLAEDDPRWWSATAIVDGEYIAKFAWSRPAAMRLAREIGVLAALAGEPFVPEVVAAGTDPLLLITRRVPGESLFEAARSLDPDSAGRQLAEFLAALHRRATRARVEAAIGALPDARDGSQHPAPTSVLRDRYPRLGSWCDWVDATLAPPRPSVLVHADLHGDNQVWARGELRLVVDFETVSAAEPEYDLRAVPSADILTAVLRHYQRLTGHRLQVDRVLAWHVRTVLSDALWRSDAGLSWIDDLSARFREFGIDPAARARRLGDDPPGTMA